MYSEVNKIINLINKGKSCNEICDILGITNKQFYRKMVTIRNNGFFFDRRYYSDGNILYNKLTNLKFINDSCKNFKIITRPDENNLKALAISDIHFGSKLERLDLLDRAYNYCTKNGIHIIFITGDLIDGTFGRGEKRIKDVEKQITHLKNHYPFDKNILNFGIGGDHDISALNSTGQDFTEVLRNYRHDMIMVNYNSGYVEIKNDVVYLRHNVESGKKIDIGSNCPIMLIGHSHKYEVSPKYNGSALCIKVPSLSDININDGLPTALELDFSFKNGITCHLIISQIYFGDKDYILGQFNHEFNRSNNLFSESRYNLEEYSFKCEKPQNESEEDYIKVASSVETHDKSIGTKKKVLSQTEKFHKKWDI